MNNEEWGRIAGHPNHFVSNKGRIRSQDHVVNDKGRPSHRKGKIFHLTAGGNGYIRVAIEKKWYNVHRLVAETFLQKIDGNNVVNHINGDKTDNRVENLEWTTPSGNVTHAHKTGLNRMSEDGRKRVADAQRGRKMSEAARKALALHRRVGYKHREETKQKISQSTAKWHKENGKNKTDI